MNCTSMSLGWAEVVICNNCRRGFIISFVTNLKYLHKHYSHIRGVDKGAEAPPVEVHNVAVHCSLRGEYSNICTRIKNILGHVKDWV